MVGLLDRIDLAARMYHARVMETESPSRRSVGTSVRSKWPRKRELAIVASGGETVLRRMKLSEPDD